MINITIKRFLKVNNEKQRGATAVEFAIVILIFITIIFGIIEFGLLMYNQHIATNAAREGARFGIVTDRKTYAQIENIVDLYGEQYIVTFGNKIWDVTIDNLDDGITTYDDNDIMCKIFNETLSVKVEYDYDFLFFPFSRKISSTTRMICE